MADSKISALPSVASVDTAQEFAVNDAGTTSKANVNQLGNFIDSRTQQGVLCSHASDQAITTATWTALAFDTEEWKVGAAGIHSTVTNNSRFISLADGEWHIAGNVQWEAIAEDFIIVTRIIKNSTTELWRNIYPSLNDATWASFTDISALVQLTAGDYIEARVYHTRGSDVDVLSTITRFGMYLAGR